jgi:hypothetical protein
VDDAPNSEPTALEVPRSQWSWTTPEAAEVEAVTDEEPQGEFENGLNSQADTAEAAPPYYSWQAAATEPGAGTVASQEHPRENDEEPAVPGLANEVLEEPAAERSWSDLAAALATTESPSEEADAEDRTTEQVVETTSAPAATALELTGRVVLEVSPVPDFDRLLNLDAALGRLPFIRNVTLADYAGEDVTFRVELTEMTTVDRLTTELKALTGGDLEVVAAVPGQLTLRVGPGGQ